MRRRGTHAEGPDPVDRHVGYRVRLRRSLLGLSQTRLGEAVGISFQQIQKYERGMNRISASKLFLLSCALEVPVSFFFDGIARTKSRAAWATECRTGGPDASEIAKVAPMKREIIELVRAYGGIEDKRLRGKTRQLIKAIARHMGSRGR